jgi:NAD(P)-dependent dehydrogenase (short-subunit alcohol dehydrogenase family)
MESDMKLDGLTAIVTGGSQGLGFSIAKRFVQEGASVVIAARGPLQLHVAVDSLKRFGQAQGQQVIGVPCDVSKDEDVETLIKAAEKTGRLDVVVNNAAVFGPMENLETADWATWVQTINVNLLGTVNVCRKAIPHLKNASRGKIINVSGGGLSDARPALAAYTVSKAAIVRFTEELAAELPNCDVNAMAPGPMMTRFMDRVEEAGPEKIGQDFYNELTTRHIGNNAFAIASDLAAFLASSDSDGITGRLLSARYDDTSVVRDMLIDNTGSDLYRLRRVDRHTMRRNQCLSI